MTDYILQKFNGRETTTLRVYAKGEPIEFETPFRNLAEVKPILLSCKSEFAHSLAKSIDSVRGPSDKQAAWAHKLAVDAITPKPQPKVANVPTLQAVIDMLHKARDAQKRLPKIELLAEGGTRIVIKLRKSDDAIVTDGGAYGDNTLYGFVDVNGNYKPTRGNTAAVEERLTELAADPAKVAGQHGVATGECSFCNRELSDARSRSVGYGPICAAKFGLPYGDTSVADAADAAAKDATDDEPLLVTPFVADDLTTTRWRVARGEHTVATFATEGEALRFLQATLAAEAERQAEPTVKEVLEGLDAIFSEGSYAGLRCNKCRTVVSPNGAIHQHALHGAVCDNCWREELGS
tara:strand:+ start:4461 stop:5510 length:1050 start_codon:yes stop_codon:yes gene_type:complete